MTDEKIGGRLIREEYKNWKKSAAQVYDLALSDALEWPSPTVEWVPESEKLILGTRTEGDPNYLMLAEVTLPLGAANAGDTKVQVAQQINHDGVVNRARYLPVNPWFIATKTACPQVYVFDCCDHPIRPLASGGCKAKYILQGHNAGGYGIGWNPFYPAHLLSGSDDAQICLWDLAANTSRNTIVDVFRKFKVHEGPVNDVAWNSQNEYLFGSVGDDRCLFIWDLRDSCVTKPAQSVIAHQSAVNCLAFNPMNEWCLATGSDDKTVKVFDLRKIKNAVHTFNFHKEKVFQVGWNPRKETVLASCCGGGRLLVWDRSRIGSEQTSKEGEEGPPELLHIHAGHTSEILDFSWNRDEMVASVAKDHILQIWKISPHVYRKEKILPEKRCRSPTLQPYASICIHYFRDLSHFRRNDDPFTELSNVNPSDYSKWRDLGNAISKLSSSRLYVPQQINAEPNECIWGHRTLYYEEHEGSLSELPPSETSWPSVKDRICKIIVVPIILWHSDGSVPIQLYLNIRDFHRRGEAILELGTIIPSNFPTWLSLSSEISRMCSPTLQVETVNNSNPNNCIAEHTTLYFEESRYSFSELVPNESLWETMQGIINRIIVLPVTDQSSS